jgi:hypothetical protein
MPYAAFVSEVEQPCAALLDLWRTEFAAFCDGLRDLRDLRERGERAVAIGLEAPPPELGERVAAVAAFRAQHEELLRVAREGLGPAVLEEVQVRRECFRNLVVLVPLFLLLFVVFSCLCLVLPPSHPPPRRPTGRRGCCPGRRCSTPRSFGRRLRPTSWRRCALRSRRLVRRRTCSPFSGSIRPSLSGRASATPSQSTRTFSSDRWGYLLSC